MALEQRDGERIEPLTQRRCVVRVFGGMSVDLDGVPVSIGGARQRRLLALLVLRSGSVVTLDWLAEHLWSDEERPQNTVAPLRTYVSRLRHALPEDSQEWIETHSGGYRLSAPVEAVEHLWFDSLRARATAARDGDDPLAALAHLDEALTLWRGEPFRELEDFDWARATTEQLVLDRLEMLEERWEVALALGRHTQITGELAAFTAEHGLRDRAVRQHALALHRCGRTTEALRTIDAHRRLLAEQSGLEPSPAIVELEASILAGDTSLDAEKPGRPLRGYRLLEEIGNGAFSVVWRGIQPSVGREVAVKQIREELASQPEFIRRFEAEAQMVAAIEHPHIVPLIDFWRDPDSAYLVMRLLRGGTLERRLDDGPLTVAEAMSMARQVGGALASAHAQGVVHRDVKPANILFDREGNAFLSDFGIALDAAESSGPEAALSPGSPAYAAPEQIRQEQLGPEADVYSLGVVLAECLGETDLPGSIRHALDRATDENRERRFASTEELLDALTAPGSPLVATAIGERTAVAANPYKGLRAFDQGDSDSFFGRERLTHELVGRLASDSIESRCVVVVGPSGSGKSSVVRAGLVPAVRSGAIEGSADWFTSTMVPGADPYESLEAALLRIAVNPPATLLTQLRDGERGILRAVRRCLGAEDARVLLTIDQFEEVFTGSAAKRSDDFLAALAVAVNDPTSPLRLVITIRADYYDRPLAHPDFAPIVKSCAVDVTPLAGDELERAIVEPARRAGIDFEPGLPACIAAEAAGRVAALPLLQYTLSELFDQRKGQLIDVQTYDEIGGLSGALAARAESIYEAADGRQQRALRNIFGRMTDPSADAADIRRRVPVVDLGASPENFWALEQLGEARLITFDRDVASREPTIEVAHEALLREWPRLVGWLVEDLDVLRSAAVVGVAADSWDEGGRALTDLYRGWRLDNAVDLARTSPDRLRRLDHEFVEASSSAAISSRRSEAKRIRRLRRLVVGFGVALLVAVLAGALALRQFDRADGEAQRAREAAADAAEQTLLAEDQSRLADTQRAAALASAQEAELATLISRSAALIGDDPESAVLLALEAHRRSPGSETDQAVLNALGSSTFANRVSTVPPLNDPLGGCPETEVNAEGTMEFGIRAGQLVSRDPLTGVVEEHGPAPAPCVLWLGDTQSNRRVVIADDGRRMWLGPMDGPLDVERDFEVPTFLLSRSFNDTHRLLFHRQGAARTGVMSILDDRTGEDVGAPITGGLGLTTAVANDDGSVIAVAFSFNFRPEGSGLVAIVDGTTGEELRRFDSRLQLHQLVIDDQTGELVTSSNNTGSIMTFDLETGEMVSEVQASSTSGRRGGGLTIRQDGLLVAVSPSQIEVLDRRTGVVGTPVQLRGVQPAAIRPDGSVLTVDPDLRLTIIDPQSNALINRTWPIDPFAEVAFADGRAGVVRQPGSAPEIIDLSTGQREIYELYAADDEPIIPAAAIPDGDGYWTITEDSIFRRWVGDDPVAGVRLGSPPFTGNVHEDRHAMLRWGSDASFVMVTVVDTGPAELRVVLEVPAPSGATAIPTLDGGVHILDTDGRLHTYDGQGVLIREMFVPERDLSRLQIPPGAVVGTPISMDPTSGRLAMAGAFGEAVLVDPARGDVEVLPGVDAVQNIAFVRSGELLVIVTKDGTVSLWDVEREQSAGQVWTGTGSSNVGLPWYDEDTDSVWVTTSGNLIEIPLDPAGWVERSCDIVGRDFTQDEWERFVPGDEPVQSACR